MKIKKKKEFIKSLLFIMFSLIISYICIENIIYLNNDFTIRETPQKPFWFSFFVIFGIAHYLFIIFIIFISKLLNNYWK